MQPVQYAGQPAVPGQVYAQYPTGQYPVPQNYAYGQPQGQQAWQPGMYYYPQQPIPQQQIPAATYAPQPAQPQTQPTPQAPSAELRSTPAPNTISSMSTTPIQSPVPTPIPQLSELGQSKEKP